MPSLRPHSPTPLPRRFAARRIVASVAFSVAFVASSAALAAQAAADELGDVQRLYRAGQTSAALARADQFLADKPADPEMRFLKGVMLADEKRNDEAAAVFVKLTEDHPDLVEPFNNLAAIYAAQGDYAKARGTLEQALRTNPSYATAQENLGDVYIAMAGRAYARAAQLAPDSATVAPKLALVRQLLSPAPPAAVASAAAAH